jgi:hypothetical protein
MIRLFTAVRLPVHIRMALPVPEGTGMKTDVRHETSDIVDA